MSVQARDRIDFMSVDAATNTFWLNMTEERDWSTIGEEFKELTDKVNVYIGEALSEDLNRQVPESMGKVFGIRLYCSSTPTEDALHILSLIKAECKHFKIQFAVILLEGEQGREIPIQTGEVSGINQIEN
jgi:hypothetical protein